MIEWQSPWIDNQTPNVPDPDTPFLCYIVPADNSFIGLGWYEYRKERWFLKSARHEDEGYTPHQILAWAYIKPAGEEMTELAQKMEEGRRAFKKEK